MRVHHLILQCWLTLGLEFFSDGTALFLAVGWYHYAQKLAALEKAWAGTGLPEEDSTGECPA